MIFGSFEGGTVGLPRSLEVNLVRLFLRHGRPVVSVTPNEHPTEWSFRLHGKNLRPILAGKKIARRQAARPTVRLNGAIFIAPSDHLLRGQGFVGQRTLGFLMPPERSIDIDTPLDLQIAKTLIRNREARPEAVTFRLGHCLVGHGHRCFIIAEAGVNHNGSLALAKKLVEVAMRAGADAVKFQTFKTEKVVTASAPKAAYQKKYTGGRESQFQMVKRLELSEAHHRELFSYCRAKGILFLSSPFDGTSANFLNELGVVAFKIPSGEITNLPFLGHLARKRKPLILSTGMSTLEEVHQAVSALRENGCEKLILLHCVSSYPARPEDANLRAMRTLEEAFHTPVGYSDHTEGIDIALAAAALGACVIEKHFTLDRSMPGPDHKASIEPLELKALVAGIRKVESALGTGLKAPADAEMDTAAVARKSLVAARDIPAGKHLTRPMIAIRRPGTGIAPTLLHSIIGRRARRTLKADHLITWEDLE